MGVLDGASQRMADTSELTADGHWTLYNTSLGRKYIASCTYKEAKEYIFCRENTFFPGYFASQNFIQYHIRPTLILPFVLVEQMSTDRQKKELKKNKD